ncbi:hypothetical protein FPV67DRAFT_628829 [Lyophyllum atratum]|nr:hypothetical protein FPV67DRAFT_628829 [Lyophyllum atratum]
MPPIAPRIPQDIIGLVIDELGGETPALRHCSMVSSSFRDFAQAQLFCSITIHLEEGLNQVNENLRAILTNRPRIGGYVKSLALCIDDVEEAAILSALLSTLINVRSLSLMTLGDVEWASFSDQSKAAFLQLLWSPTLSWLHLNFSNFPIPYLRFCTHLKQLQLLHPPYDSLEIEDTPEPELMPFLSPLGLPNRTTREGHLLSLTTENTPALKQLLAALQHTGSTLSSSCIEQYNGCVRQDEDFPEIRKLLALACPSLRKLCLGVYLSASSSLQPTPSLQGLPNLVRLQFTIVFMHALGSFRWMCQVLEAIPPHNSLDTIVITAHLHRNISAAGWGWIDALLTRERHHKSLRNVSIKVPKAMEPRVLHAMPRLAENGWLHFLS